MMRSRYREAPLPARALLFLLGGVLTAGLLPLSQGGCAAELPSAWRIAAEPRDPVTGQEDPRGKLRLLAVAAEPPELAPGESARLSALAVTHPRHGLAADGAAPGTGPRGLDLLWLACRPAEGLAAVDACGLGAPGSTTEEEELAAQGDGALLSPPAGTAPGPLLVTLVVADEAQPGGARGCLAAARAAGGAVALPNHCVIGVKRVKLSPPGQAPRNRNPSLRSLALSATEDGGWRLVATRGEDAVEREPDVDGEEGALRDEVLTVAFFTTAGTLGAGRGAFTALDCDEGDACPAGPDSAVPWEPPLPERATTEAPQGVVHFFAVLRDDRGGLSYGRLSTPLAR